MDVPLVRQNASQINTDSFKIFQFMKLLKVTSLGWVSLCCIEWRVRCSTLQETNISPKNGILKIIFLFPRWDMLISCRVSLFHPLKGGWFWPVKPEDSSCSSPWMPRGKLPTQWWRMRGSGPGYMDVSKNRGTPKWMVKIMENPIEMGDLGVPLFLETSIWFMIYNSIDHLYFLCHFSLLKTHKSNATLRSDFLCLAGCFFNHHLQGSLSKSANFHEFTIWDNLMSGIPSMMTAGSESVHWSQSMMLAPTLCWKNMLKTQFWRAYEKGIAGYCYSPPCHMTLLISVVYVTKSSLQKEHHSL